MNPGDRLSNSLNMAEDVPIDAFSGDLLEGVRRGDQAAWRRFVDRYEGVVAATVIGMIGRGPDAEDIGQEVFIRFLKQANSFRGDADVSTYLTRSAINLSLNAIKRRSRMRRWFLGPPEDSIPAPDEAPDAALERRDLSEAVSRAIRRLKPDQRSVVVLRLVRGLPTREAATVLGIPEGTVMSRLKRAQDQLRQDLKTAIADA